VTLAQDLRTADSRSSKDALRFTGSVGVSFVKLEGGAVQDAHERWIAPAQSAPSTVSGKPLIPRIRSPVGLEDHGSPTWERLKPEILHRSVDRLAEGGLTATIGDWVDHVRLYGNAGVHPDLFGDVSIEEAEDVANLTQTLIELLYITPAKIAQRQAERLK
jgi:hypothetical protein